MSERVKTIEQITGYESGWYASRDGEEYTIGPEATKEAVIQAARNDELGYPYDDGAKWRFTVAYCTRERVRLSRLFDCDGFLERCEDLAALDDSA